LYPICTFQNQSRSHSGFSLFVLESNRSKQADNKESLKALKALLDGLFH
jgi:hypothetical protein